MQPQRNRRHLQPVQGHDEPDATRQQEPLTHNRPPPTRQEPLILNPQPLTNVQIHELGLEGRKYPFLIYHL